MAEAPWLHHVCLCAALEVAGRALKELSWKLALICQRGRQADSPLFTRESEQIDKISRIAIDVLLEKSVRCVKARLCYTFHIHVDV